MVATSGRMGGFRGQTEGAAIQEKIKMLQSEGIDIHSGRIQNFKDVLFRFSEDYKARLSW